MLIQLIALRTVLLSQKPISILCSRVSYTKHKPLFSITKSQEQKRTKKRKTQQFNSKSSVTAQGVEKQINGCIFYF